ncbi:MAG: heavy metal-responsive transcriptional regulator [Isosphaeraceae bacterium]
MTSQPSTPLRSGALARLLGVSPDTLRLYERKKLLRPPARSSNGYRCYSPDSIERVRLIRAALSIGFTLDELARILKIRDAGGIPCHKVRDLAAAKLQALEQHIEQLASLRDQLREVLAAWGLLLEHTPQPKRAGLLEALAATAAGKSARLPAHFYAAITQETRR